jgi:hypothetical protein
MSWWVWRSERVAGSATDVESLLYFGRISLFIDDAALPQFQSAIQQFTRQRKVADVGSRLRTMVWR